MICTYASQSGTGSQNQLSADWRVVARGGEKAENGIPIDLEEERTARLSCTDLIENFALHRVVARITQHMPDDGGTR